MRSRIWIAMAVLVVAVVAGAMLPAMALAADHTNAQCVSCHDPVFWGIDFEVPDVNRDTACRKCHLDSLASTHPYHNQNGNCGAVCHPGYGASLVANVPTGVYTGGAFASPGSQATDASLLHVIHSQARWPVGVSTDNSKCASCHAVAACDACHDNGDPAASHGEHGQPPSFPATTTPIVPWVGTTSPGVTALESEDTAQVGRALLCGSPACHDITGIGSSAPKLMDSMNHDADPANGYVYTEVTKTGTWKDYINTKYTMGHEAQSNNPNATISINFTGQRVVLVADKDPYRGKGEISIDGVVKGTVDFYNAATLTQQAMWTSEALSPGLHTFSMRVTYTKNAAARGYYVPLDQLRVYEVSPGSIAPQCGSCHFAEAPDPHGGEHPGGGTPVTFSHDASPTADNILATTDGSYRCDSCHTTRYREEHIRTSSAPYGDPNATCYCHFNTPQSAPMTWTGTWEGETAGCTYGTECHTKTGRTIHGTLAAKHTPAADAGSIECQSCHPGDLASAHKNTVPGNGWMETNSCTVCHGRSPKYTTAKSCVDPSCHGGTGIVSMATHYSLAQHNMTGGSFGRAVTSGGSASATCADCHESDLSAAHTSVTAVAGSPYGATVDCNECHADTRSYGAAEVAAHWTNDLCEDCHKIGGSAVMHSASTAPAVADTGSAGCGNTGASCHTTTDLHALHKNAAGGCALTGCHNYAIEAFVPTAKSCGTGGGACHGTYTNSTHAHATDQPKHQPTALTQANDASFYATKCGDCHDVRNSNTSLTNEHAMATSAKTTDATNNCKNCHNNANSATAVANNWSAKDSTSACAACHTGGLAVHATSNTAAHTVTSTGCSASGAGCHNTGDLAAVGSDKSTAIHDNCLRCHDRTATAPNMVYDPTKKTCGSGRNCHATAGQYNTTTYVHNGTTGAGLADGNDAPHHTAASMTGTVSTGANNTCGSCHSGTLGASHSNTMTGWSNTCTGCHNATTPVNGVTQVKANWATDSCTDCHTVGNGWHSKFGTSSHNGVPTGANTCDPACHASYDTLDLAEIHDGKPNGCKTAGCHNLDTPMGSAGKTCGTGGACHGTYADGNHGSATAHTFSAASDYNAAAETGCTNSGAGCHSTETNSYGNYSIAQYHPAASVTCLASKCHTSPSYSKTGAGRECASCHDGQYSFAGDVVNLTSSTIGNGHYNVTTHTPEATNMSYSLTAGGTAGATCSQCHSPSIGGGPNGYTNQHTNITIAGSPYGTALGCGECHNDTRVNGQTEVTTATRTDQCEDCHKTTGTTSNFDHATTVPAVADTGALGCGATGTNCHTSTDLHALHKNAAGGCNLTGCHNYGAQALLPTQKSCGTGGTCHTGYTKNTAFPTHTNSLETTAHAPTNTAQSAATWSVSGGSYTCGGCHIVTKAEGGLDSEHALTTSAKTTSAGNNCANCHNNALSTTAVSSNWSAKDTSTACAQCHTSTLAIHADQNSAIHTVTNTGCGASGVGCHNTNDISSTGTTATAANTVIHNSCMHCHDKAGAASWSNTMIAGNGNLKYVPATKTCGAATGCHTSAYYSTANLNHRIGRGDAVTGTDARHLATGMTSTVTSGTASSACSACHDSYLGNAHSTTNATNNLGSGHTAWTNACTSCHNETRTPTANAATTVKGNWPTDTCADCHSTYHDTIGTASHTGTSTQGCGASGTNCHTTYDLLTLHKNNAGGCEFSGCHDATNKGKRPTAKTCGTGGACHTTYSGAEGFTHVNSQELADHRPTSGNTAQSAATWAVGGTTYTCGQCHLVTYADGGLYSAEHTSTNSAKTLDATNICKNCHNNSLSTTAITSNWSSKDSSSACAQCHTGTLAIHATENTALHTTTNTGCSGTGIGCHNTTDLSSTGTTATAANTVIHNSCVRCHDKAGAASWSSAMAGTGNGVKYNPSVKTCGQATGCHTSGFYSTANYNHQIGLPGAVNGNDATHHTATGMTSTITSGTASAACSACHSSTLAAAHDPAKTTAAFGSGHTAWTSACTGCHNENRAPTAGAATQVKGNWTNDTCVDCHTPSYHNTYATGHTGSGTGCTGTGAGCHNTTDLAALHGQTKTNGCQLAGCHDSVDKAMGSATKTCGSTSGGCHATYTGTNHGGVSGDDTTHTANAAYMSTALTTGVATASCSACHTGTLATAHKDTSTTANLGSGNTAWSSTAQSTCLDCHSATAAPVTNAPTIVKNNWATGNDQCADCHTTLHNTLASGHTGSSTSNCGASGNGCHTTYDLRTLHGQTKTNGCQLAGCHDAKDKAMTSGVKTCGQAGGCHATYTASSHGGTVTGNETSHTAGSMTTIVDATYNAGGANTCDVCHSAGLATAHKETSTTATLKSGNTGWGSTAANICSDCHNTTTPDNSVTTIKTNSWSAKTCDQCHVTNGNGKHALYASNHIGTASGCASGTCHSATNDLRAIHNNSVTSNASTAGCDSAGCHDSKDKVMTSAAKTCGSTGTCHTDKNSGHGSIDHDIDNVWKNSYASTVATFTYNGIAYAPSNSVGCGGTSPFGVVLGTAGAWSCHYSDLTKEHGDTASGGAGRTMENGGVNCGNCHTDKGGTVGTNASESVIQNAIAANDLRCPTCHNGNDANGTAAPHQTVSTTGSYQRGINQVAPEFRSWKTTTNNVESSGGHRVRAELPDWPLRTVFSGAINGVTVTGALSPKGTYTGNNPRTATTWKFGDVVLCEDCHWWNAAPTGPQGAAVPFYVDGQKSSNNLPAGVATHWYNGLGSSTTPPAPCKNCHLSLNSSTHRSAHGYPCSSCHVKIPHAWKRPRLLRRVTGGTIEGVAQDVEPYATPAQANAMTAYKISSGQTAFTSSGGCNTNCAHTATTPYWP